MPDYHAVACKTNSSSPFRVQFSAKSDVEAVAELCAAAGVQNTSGLVQFEILQVLENGHYRRAALKEIKKGTTAERLAASTAVVVAPPPTVPLTLAETSYTSYITEELQ